MKKICATLIGGLMIIAGVSGQTQPSQAGNATGVPSPTPYTIISKGANSQVWQRTVYEQTPSGQTAAQSQQYTELATGLNYEQNGEWVPSQEVIDILADGTASATQGQHQAYFPNDIGSGSITLVTPDGLQLQSQPLGLFYDDGSSTVMIAESTNSVGQLISPNQIIYTNAFTGLKADLLYTYTKAGFEQDVILNEQPQSPEAYGLNPQTARLQMLTEFFNPPQPAVQTLQLPEQAGLGLSDDTLDFGTMKMVPGRAFLLGANADDANVLVGKQWISVGDRRFLAESVPVAAVAGPLSQLPMAQTLSANSRSPLNVVSKKRLLPPHRLIGKAKTTPIQAAQAQIPKKGLLLDYQTLNSSQTNTTFQADTTYYISGAVSLFGTNTFEGGAVIKYTNNAGLFIESPSEINWLGSAYRPVTFTAKDDNSVGEHISGSTGSPSGYYATYALGLNGGSAALNYLRIAYAASAIQINNSANLTLYNAQIVNCLNGINWNYSGGAALVRNALFANVAYDFNTYDLTATNTISAQNVTFASCSSVFVPSFYYPYFYPHQPVFVLTNCIFASVTTNDWNFAGAIMGANNGYYNVSWPVPGGISDSAYPFQSVGAGNYYLTNGCPFTNAGTAGIDPILMAELPQKTTRSPQVYTNETITTNVLLQPVVLRDTNASPDLGYHYDPIDYITENYTVTNAALTISNGTVIACYDDTGIQLLDGSSITAAGTPLAPVWFTYYTTVQEQSRTFGAYSNLFYAENVLEYHYGSAGPNGTFQFCKFSAPGDASYFFFDDSYDYLTFSYAVSNCSSYSNLLVQNCELWNGNNDVSGAPSATTVMKNSLFNRSHFYASDSASMNYSFSLDDNLFWGITNGSADVQFYLYATNPWSIFNNDFDTCRINVLGTSTTNGYNAYLNCSGDGRLYPPNANDVVQSASLAYQTGSWGTFYQPANSPLRHEGSTAAGAIGLYWYTTQTNQTIEGTNLVDIGYHYVAITNGYPWETLGTNIPNYLLYPDGPPTNLLEITSEPTNQTVNQGSNATFSVTAVGTPPLGYQWFWNGLPLSDVGGVSGSGNATLNLYGVNPDQAGNYYVIVTNSSGSVTSSIVTLTVLLSPTNDYDTPPLYLMPPYAYWNVADISDPAQPVSIGELQEPFSEPDYAFTGSAYNDPPQNTLWHTNITVTVTNAYGVTYDGGSNGVGILFEIGVGGETNFTVIHTFNGTNDGTHPCSQLALSGSTFYGISTTIYGTTYSGGTSNYGTVFKVNTDGSEFTNLYQFTGSSSDGKYPQTGLLISGNTLYGTTTNSIFKINTDGSDFTCLTNNINGASQLILSLSGETLYGTTPYGGSSNYGIVFSINTDGTGFTNLYDFTGGTNGEYPNSELEFFGIGTFFADGPTNGVLYGTTHSGGVSNYGMVFSIHTDGNDFMDLYDFTNGSDGAYPIGGLLVTNNSTPGNPSYLYGTTSSGGTNGGGGTVFGLNLDGTDFQPLYSFGAGAKPEGKLVLEGGTLYGTTSGGGVHANGMVFSINGDGTGFSDLYDFTGGSDGRSPAAGLTLPVVDNWSSIWSLDTTINVSAANTNNLSYSTAIDNYYILFVNGNFVSNSHYFSGDAQWSPYAPLPYLHPGQNDVRVIIGGDYDGNDYFTMAIKSALTNTIFGTTAHGGTSGAGTVFEITPNGYETNFYSFTGGSGDGDAPIGDLVLSSNVVYGVTESGGTIEAGTIFSYVIGSTTDEILHAFIGKPDGAVPMAGLILSGNTLYGTTYSGGSNGVGEIFRINTDGSGYTDLYSFGAISSDGYYPQASLVLTNNILYGTASMGGLYGAGAIFRITTNGLEYTNLYFFNGSPDGASPQAELTFSGNTLYGTTYGGGDYNGNPENAIGDGTIFSFIIGSTTDAVLHVFTNALGDGANPIAGLTLSGNTLYGTTENGGTNGYGTVFCVGTNGIGYNTLRSFGSFDTGYGEYPAADLLILGNSLYGTAQFGGAYTYGMVFGINTNGTDFNDIYDFMNNPDGAEPDGGVCSP